MGEVVPASHMSATSREFRAGNLIAGLKVRRLESEPPLPPPRPTPTPLRT